MGYIFRLKKKKDCPFVRRTWKFNTSNTVWIMSHFNPVSMQFFPVTYSDIILLYYHFLGLPNNQVLRGFHTYIVSQDSPINTVMSWRLTNHWSYFQQVMGGGGGNRFNVFQSLQNDPATTKPLFNGYRDGEGSFARLKWPVLEVNHVSPFRPSNVKFKHKWNCALYPHCLHTPHSRPQWGHLPLHSWRVFFMNTVRALLFWETGVLVGSLAGNVGNVGHQSQVQFKF